MYRNGGEPIETVRIDQLLVARGHFDSRTRAREAITAGRIKADGTATTKPGLRVPVSVRIEIAEGGHPYVSRGGIKLAHALDEFGINAGGWICLDLGASTGGFTDVLLRSGASRIYAVDVGTDQLHPSLRNHPRVNNLEKTHANRLSRDLITDPIDLLVCDLSFISLTKAIPFALPLMANNSTIIALLKPQFELGPAFVGKKRDRLGGPGPN